MNNFTQNRGQLYELIDDNSLTILYSGDLQRTSADENYPFKVNTNFYYLTGINQDDVYLVMKKVKGTIHTTLFIVENDPVKVKWVGAQLYPNEAKEISGIDDVRFLSELDSFLVKELRSSKIKKVYLDLEVPEFKGTVDFGKVLKDKINAISFGKKIEDIYNFIVVLRGYKKDYEIELFRQDVEVTNKALQEVMKKLPSLEYENQVQAVFEGTIKYLANARTSFDTIAAAGKNAATLHYHANNQKMNSKDMILLDLGAEFNMYHADISRTYPISGKFGELEKKVYTIVLECNKHIIEFMRPGVSMRTVQNETVDFLAKGCLEAGLIKEYDEIHNYFFHGVSHHIGLDTHDPFPRYTGVLEPVMIISCEPGLYFENLGIGVRIEDDVLITEEGSECLSKDIIKEVDDIEAFMAKYSK